MEKKYQIFISSTYDDLKNERQSVISCLLDMNCIPVGMEQFPSSSLSQWEYIKKMIDMSDYYLLIVAGRYGSIDPDEKISYTEKEYRYATEKNIPIISFLLKDLENLPVSKAWKTDEEKECIIKFRDLVKNSNRLVDFYGDEKELKYAVAKAIAKITSDSPRPGWVRTDQAESAIKTAGDKSGFSEIKKLLNELQETLIDKVEQTRFNWEPVSANEIELLFDNDEKSIDIIPELSDKACTIISETVYDTCGQVLKISSLDGVRIQTNGKDLNDALVGREIAEWESAIDELIDMELLKEVGQKGQIYQMTKKGYDLADRLGND